MQHKTLVQLAAVFSIFSLSAALAHHSNAMFERDKELVVKGTVKDFQWTNPHVWIELVVDGPSGQYDYSIESSAPGVLRQHGWKFNSLKPGDKVVAKVHPLRDGRLGGGLITIEKDGVMIGDGEATATNYDNTNK